MSNFVKFDKDKLIIIIELYNKKIIISKDDIDVSSFSGGPGGQNVNRNMNGVRLIYRIPNEFRSIAKKTKELVTKSINQRNRHQNMVQAFEQLTDKVRRYFYVQPKRSKTKIPKKSKENRLKNKKYCSQQKQSRKKISDEL